MATMSHIRRLDHIGITVADLDPVTALFVGLGLEVEGRTLAGEFLDTVIGMPDSRTEIVTLPPPGGGGKIELASFVRPTTSQRSIDFAQDRNHRIAASCGGQPEASLLARRDSSYSCRPRPASPSACSAIVFSVR